MPNHLSAAARRGAFADILRVISDRLDADIRAQGYDNPLLRRVARVTLEAFANNLSLELGIEIPLAQPRLGDLTESERLEIYAHKLKDAASIVDKHGPDSPSPDFTKSDIVSYLQTIAWDLVP